MSKPPKPERDNASSAPDEAAEAALYAAFRDGPMTVLAAIQALVKLGYEEVEAERVVWEWVDGIEAEREGDRDEP
jgi:Holliday junction resolvasome RuvABC DNA-binding subunit